MTKIKRKKSLTVHWILFKFRENFSGSLFICIERKPFLKDLSGKFSCFVKMKICENRKTFFPLNFRSLR